jgi:hypothetical protein
VPVQSFSEQEKELFQKYGKVPAHKNLLANKLKVRIPLLGRGIWR